MAKWQTGVQNAGGGNLTVKFRGDAVKEHEAGADANARGEAEVGAKRAIAEKLNTGVTEAIKVLRQTIAFVNGDYTVVAGLRGEWDKAAEMCFNLKGRNANTQWGPFTTSQRTRIQVVLELTMNGLNSENVNIKVGFDPLKKALASVKVSDLSGYVNGHYFVSMRRDGKRYTGSGALKKGDIHLSLEVINGDIDDLVHCIIHEATHKYADTDDGGLFANGYIAHNCCSLDEPCSLSTKACFSNADSYAMFCGILNDKRGY